MTARVLVTGAAGFIGAQVLDRLAAHPGVAAAIGTDVRDPHDRGLHLVDVRDPAMADLLADEGIDRVVHLAAIVTPRPEHTREFLRSVDVDGTRNVLDACLATGVGHVTVTSSGAAYGYHPDSPEWIDEDDPLRGNEAFAYSDHKRQVEELLAAHRARHPELTQLVLRPGTILGEAVDNQITALFERPVVLGIAGSPTPFVFIWDTDVVDVVVAGTLGRVEGRFNLAGDGAVPLAEIAAELGKPHVRLPAWLVKGVLGVLHPLRLAPYGPEQVDFLRYRPVLANRRLREEFGHLPSKTSLEALRAWRDRG
ncbi:MAG: NAD-dependent epimerase/dehydratase family protein [Acidimicrobiia bacterium]